MKSVSWDFYEKRTDCLLPVCRSICLKLNDNVAGLICRTSFLFKFYKKQLLYRNCGTLFVYL